MKRSRLRETRRRFVVPDAAGGSTLLDALVRHVRGLSESRAKLALQVGCVFVDRRRECRPEVVLAAGCVVTVHLGRPFEAAVLVEVGTSAPVPAPRVLHEDEHVLVVFKPAGLLTAPTPEGRGADLYSALRTDSRPLFVVHRLDLATSGVLILAKTKQANRVLARSFERHDLLRRYDAFVGPGYPVDSETIERPISGRRAISHVEVLARHPGTTRLRVTLETGRTHQIRIHLAERGFPILADSQHGRRAPGDPPRLALHARLLELAHPVTGLTLRFEEELPDDLATWLRRAAS